MLNPIAHPHLAAVLALDSGSRAEERLQSLLLLWLMRYFGGAPFQTLKADGSEETRSFTHCTFDFQESALPPDPAKPQIHVVMPDRRTRMRNYSTSETGHDDDWMIDLMVKVPANLTKTDMPGISAEEVARDVGGEVEWLFGSTERAALGIHGINRVKIERPSTILPASSWQMRMLVVSCRTRREQAR